MSNIYYFQRYSQRENWLTNSTLLLLTRLQYFSSVKFQEALRNLLGADNEFRVGFFARQQVKGASRNLLGADNEFRVGFFARQQVKGASRVADGVLEQKAFKIVIETKLYDNFDQGQLEGHLSQFKKYSGQGILLGLSRHQSDDTTTKQYEIMVNQWADEHNVKVDFVSTSYLSLIDSIDKVLQDTDVEMKEILDDYLLLCQEEGVIDRKEETMLVVTAGRSLQENLRYSIYYDPVDRNHNLPFTYMGLYANGAIRAIGKVDKIANCQIGEDGQLVAYPDYEFVDLTSEETQRILDIMDETDYYDIKQGVKFFLLSDVQHCEIDYSTIRAKKYEFLREVANGFVPGMPPADVVANLQFGT